MQCLKHLLYLLLIITAAVHFLPGNSIASDSTKAVPIVPTIDLSGKTDGTGEAAIGGNIRIGVSQTRDFFLHPKASIASNDGFANLMKVAENRPSGESLPWRAGLSVGFVSLPEIQYSLKGYESNDVYVNAALEGMDACIKKCVEKPAKDDEKFCDNYKSLESESLTPAQKAIEIGVNNLCPDGLSVYNNAIGNKGKLPQRYPPFLISFGGKLGRTQFEYLESTKEDGKVFTAEDEIKIPWNAGLSLAYVRSPGDATVSSGSYSFTFEAIANCGTNWTASKTIAEWTESQGRLKKGKDGDGQSIYRDLTSSDKKPLGPPAENRELNAAIYLGGVNQRSGNFRFAAGFGARLVENEEADTLASILFLEAPFYWNFASDNKDNYKGLVRVAPAFQIVDNDDNKPNQVNFIITFSLLGQRLMFSEDFDKL